MFWEVKELKCGFYDFDVMVKDMPQCGHGSKNLYESLCATTWQAYGQDVADIYHTFPSRWHKCRVVMLFT